MNQFTMSYAGNENARNALSAGHKNVTISSVAVNSGMKMS